LSRAPFRLDGDVVAVIGAASGIGEAVARGAARQGARVVALDRDEAGLTAVAARIQEEGGVVEEAPLDVRRSGDVESALSAIVDRHGALHGVVATPGVNVRKRILDYSDEELDRVLEVNLKGSFYVLRAAGRIMAEQRRGSIVLFSSIRSVVVEPGQSVYAATKAGIVQMVRTLAAELGELSVRVNAIAPGVVETPLTAPIQKDPAWRRAYAEKSALRRWASAEEMVGPAIFLLSEAASYVTGTVLFVDGGWTAVDGRYDPG
jgi:NAD(P)-dependent dehydrogenase (short-subunit alcohol dehydrogenase family)